LEVGCPLVPPSEPLPETLVFFMHLHVLLPIEARRTLERAGSENPLGVSDPKNAAGWVIAGYRDDQFLRGPRRNRAGNPAKPLFESEPRQADP